MSKNIQQMGQDVQDRIRDLAYMMWESAGRQQGMAMEYWLKAEQEVMNTLTRASENLITTATDSAKAATAAVKTTAKPAAKAAKPAAKPRKTT